MKRLILFFVLSLVFLTGCMSVRNGNNSDNVFPSGNRFNNKKIAILPVKSQTSITTDSQSPLKKALNKKILDAVKFVTTNAVVIDSQKSLDVLNDAGKLDLIEKLSAGYEGAGAFDKKLISSLCSALKSDYLLLTRLKTEQLDVSVLGKSFSGSLEVILLDRSSSEPIWSGIGDFKRGGVFGAGGTKPDAAATELVNLAFGQKIPDSHQNNQTANNKSTDESDSRKKQEEPQAEQAKQPESKATEKKIESISIPQSLPAYSSTMITNQSNAKVRKSPSLKATVIKTLKKGEEVQIVKQKDEWFLVELTGGETGWCHNSVLTSDK